MKRLKHLPSRAALQRGLRRAWPWVLLMALGAVLFAAFGKVPARLQRPGGGDAPWSLPALPDGAEAAAAAEAVWLQRYPWGGAPPPQEVAPTPQPIPVAIVSTATGHDVVFVVAGAGETRTRVGGALPDGGRVEHVDALSVVWIDGQGQRQEQRMLSDRPRALAPTP